MVATRRATVCLEPALHRALRIKSAETERTISDLVNEAVRAALAEDAEDLAAIKARRSEPTRPFEEFLADLTARGDV